MQIKLCNITKKYKNEVDNTIENLNLTFSSGELVSIIGESGSGKSTLMNIIGGLDLNYDGNLLVDNKIINSKNVDLYRKNNIGFVFQTFNLLPHLTAYENVLLAMRLNNKIDKGKIDEIFKELNIENIVNKKPNELSGGQKQRVAIARALINNPDIILADEPTGALDSKNSDNIIELLNKIASKGKIVIIVTHSKKVSEKCSREILISNKTIINDKKNYDSYEINDINLNKETRKIKLLNLLKLSTQNMIKNLKRNLLIILASSIGIFGISFMFFLGSGVKNYVNKEINMNVNPNIVEVNKTDSMLDTVKFTKEDIKTIRKINHVDKINKNILISNLSSIVNDNTKYDIASLSTFSNLKKSALKLGRKCNDGEIVISEYLAKKMNKNINQLINKKLDLYIIDNDKPIILKKEVSISGILKSDNNDFTNNMFFSYITYNTLESLYNINNVELNVTDLSVHVDEIKNVEFVKNKIVQSGFKHSNMSKMVDDILKYLDIITFILVGISAISLLVSSIMIFIVMHINVIERTKEIGILRALGSKISEIKKLFLFESSLIGLLSGIYGCIISSIISKIINLYTKNKYNEAFINIDIKYIFICIIISIIISTIAGLKPSIKASKLDPVESLRYE